MDAYQRLKAWQVWHELAVAIYRRAKRFPADERYGLTSQTRRAAFSAAANIAEGASRRGRAEFRRFLDISLGSLGEVSYALRFARDVELLNHEEWSALSTLRVRASQLTYRLHESMRAK